MSDNDNDEKIIGRMDLWSSATTEDLYDLIGRFRHTGHDLHYVNDPDDSQPDFYIVRQNDE